MAVAAIWVVFNQICSDNRLWSYTVQTSATLQVYIQHLTSTHCRCNCIRIHLLCVCHEIDPCETHNCYTHVFFLTNVIRSRLRKSKSIEFINWISEESWKKYPSILKIKTTNTIKCISTFFFSVLVASQEESTRSSNFLNRNPNRNFRTKATQKPRPTPAAPLDDDDEEVPSSPQCPQPDGFFADSEQCDKYYACR